MEARDILEENKIEELELQELILSSIEFINSKSDYNLTITFGNNGWSSLCSNGEHIAELITDDQMQLYVEGLMFPFCRKGAVTA